MDNNYIPTKKKRIRYTFAHTEDEFRPKPKRVRFSFFYQIAEYPETDNRGRKKFHMRKYIFNDKYEYKMENHYLDTKACRMFYKSKPVHKYKIYSVIDLNTVSKPTLYDFQTSTSGNLNNSHAQDNLNSMYATFTNESVDYAKLYRGRSTNGVFGPISNMEDGGQINNNMVTDFSNFN
jgi:hypothetical protein